MVAVRQITEENEFNFGQKKCEKFKKLFDQSKRFNF
jgi:hypothetical protein